MTSNEWAKRAISMLYVAIKKESWEEGPTVSEAIAAAHDWFYNTYGYEGRHAASCAIPRMMKPRRRKSSTKGEAK